ncbi:MAG: hypothetical protein ACREDM_10975 [Methylocella sp.]
MADTAVVIMADATGSIMAAGVITPAGMAGGIITAAGTAAGMAAGTAGGMAAGTAGGTAGGMAATDMAARDIGFQGPMAGIGSGVAGER